MRALAGTWAGAGGFELAEPLSHGIIEQKKWAGAGQSPARPRGAPSGVSERGDGVGQSRWTTGLPPVGANGAAKGARSTGGVSKSDTSVRNAASCAGGARNSSSFSHGFGEGISGARCPSRTRSSSRCRAGSWTLRSPLMKSLHRAARQGDVLRRIPSIALLESSNCGRSGAPLGNLLNAFVACCLSERRGRRCVPGSWSGYCWGTVTESAEPQAAARKRLSCVGEEGEVSS